jgi:hypothetical protein
MRAPLAAALLLFALTTHARAQASQAGRDQHFSTQVEKLDTSKGKFFAGLGLRLGL